MKTQTTVLFSCCAILLGMGNPGAHAQTNGLTVHEWGTFTSFQGSDGVLLSWKPLNTTELPKFVYTRANPRLDRAMPGLVILKGEISSLQRMETPVLYFYSDRELTVDVSVRFPEGTITEWFPQAGQIGPAVTLAASNAIPAALAPAVPESLIRWPEVRILPPNFPAGNLPALPADGSGSHYFAARETDSSTLLVAFLSKRYPVTMEWEKFLFYRGVANFKTPLRVTMNTADSVTVANTGADPLSNLVVVAVNPESPFPMKSDFGEAVYLENLAPGSEKTVSLKTGGELKDTGRLAEETAEHLARSLVKAGLYPKEATAMVNTWKRSWFEERGVRVLYTLPRTWTDRTLPLSVNPAPRQTVRVMVGRAEVLSYSTEKALASQLEKAKTGDQAGVSETRLILSNLGRFSEAALNHALDQARLSPEERERVVGLIHPPPNPGKPGGAGP